MNANVVGVLSCVIMLTLDFMWITFMKPIYAKWISAVQGASMTVRFIPAAAAYILMAMSVFFILIPLVKHATSSLEKMLKASAVGLCTYGIYNTTNYAIFKNYSLTMAIVDTIWGMSLFSILGFFIMKNI
jgi:uncharacterized membrane protein